ncbi:MAG: hypothetical protein ACREJ2_03855, partial [Planctomycetota bacterium]
MDGLRDEAMLGLALQRGLINAQQASLVRDRQRQFFEVQRPVSVSSLLRALKLVSDEQLVQLELTVNQTHPLAPGAPARPGTV